MAGQAGDSQRGGQVGFAGARSKQLSLRRGPNAGLKKLCK